MTLEEFNRALDRYREAFGEPFPLYMSLGISEEDTVDIINECIKCGEPYDPPVEQGRQY